MNKRMLKSAVIYGCGKAGERFCKVIENRNDMKILAIIDPKFAELKSMKSKKMYESFKKFREFNFLNPDFFIVATIDKDHFENFMNIKRFYPNSKIITEKPLCKKSEEVSNIIAKFKNEEIVIHFVERYSLAVPIARDFIKTHCLRPVRAITFWGKNRLGDQRDTMGVYSEISHSIDLVWFICNYSFENQHEISEPIGARSDFNGVNTMKTDSISFNLKDKETDFFCTFHSSFMWHKRKREIVIYLKSHVNKVYMICIEFDSPEWDFDQIRIMKFHKNNWKMCFEKKYSPIKNKIIGNQKIDRFLSSVLYEKYRNVYGVPCLQNGVFVQRILNEAMKGERHETKFY